MEGNEGNDGNDEMEFFEDDNSGADSGGSGGSGSGDAGDKGANAGSTKYDFSKFKDVFDDEEEIDEEKVISKTKGLKKENEDLRILAKGREAIESDKDIINYRGLLRNNDESLAFMVHVNRFIKSGLDQNEAQNKAKSYIDKLKLKPEGIEQIEETALDARASLRERISLKEGEIIEKIKSAQGSVDLRPKDSKVIEKSKEQVAKLEKFLGFKLPAEHKAKIVKDAQDYIGSDQELKDIKDPVLRAKWAMFVKHEKQWEKNVESRKSGKVKAIEAAVQNPKIAASRGSKPPIVGGKKQQGNGRVMKNPGAFLGG